MGSPFNLIFYSDDSVKAATLADRSFHLVDSLNLIFSDYIPASELNRLSALQVRIVLFGYRRYYMI
ncbi:MAG: hypothetical protein WDO71_21535 [Bacteroidota bacterium]